jgi:hypothetical protein
MWILPQLSALKTLTLPMAAMAVLFEAAPYDLEGEWKHDGDYAQRQSRKKAVLRRESARSALHRAMKRVVELKLTHVQLEPLADLLLSPALRSGLPNLSISGYLPLFTTAHVDLFHGFLALRLSSLSLKVPPPLPLDPLWTTLHIPSLLSLDIPSDGFGVDTLSLLSQIAPNLRHLSLTSSESSPPPPPTTVLLPSLSTLTTSGPLHNALIAALSSSPFHHLNVDLLHRRECQFRVTVDSFFGPNHQHLPKTLKTLRIAVTSQLRPGTEHLVREDLAARGITLELHWHPMDFDDDGTLEHDGHFRIRTQASRVIREDLIWGLETAEWLETTEDTAGLQELTEVLTRLREKRKILEQ